MTNVAAAGWSPVSRTLAELLGELSASWGDRVAVQTQAGATTFAELEHRAGQVATALSRAGVGRDDRVALLCTNRIEWIETYFGTARSGGTVHAINTWVTGPELASLLDEAGPKVLVMLAEHGRNRYLDELRRLVPEAWDSEPSRWRSARYPGLREIVVIGGEPPIGARSYEEWLESAPEPVPPDQSAPAELISANRTGVVLYTSGSAAMPKAVPLLDYAMIENGYHIGQRMSLTFADRVWLGSPLFWSYGCANALMATLTHGATLVLQEQFSAATAVDMLELHSCTAAYLLPTMVRALLEVPELDPSRLKTLRTGLTIGTPEDVRLAAEELGIEDICNVYGATETYGNCCVTPHATPLARRLVSQGPPLPGVTIRIVDPASDAVLGCDELGEIQAKGYLTPGYLGDSSAGEVFTPDGFYRSGDLGYLDSEGWLHFTARATEMIKTSGINVAPAEVEQCLMTHPQVEQVAVVGVPDARKDELVVAYVVVRSGAAPGGDELIAHCRDHLASYKVPARVHLVAELPKTGSGKLSRRDLREQAVQSRVPPVG